MRKIRTSLTAVRILADLALRSLALQGPGVSKDGHKEGHIILAILRDACALARMLLRMRSFETHAGVARVLLRMRSEEL